MAENTITKKYGKFGQCKALSERDGVQCKNEATKNGFCKKCSPKPKCLEEGCNRIVGADRTLCQEHPHKCVRLACKKTKKLRLRADGKWACDACWDYDESEAIHQTEADKLRAGADATISICEYCLDKRYVGDTTDTKEIAVYDPVKGAWIMIGKKKSNDDLIELLSDIGIEIGIKSTYTSSKRNMKTVAENFIEYIKQARRKKDSRIRKFKKSNFNKPTTKLLDSKGRILNIKSMDKEDEINILQTTDKTPLEEQIVDVILDLQKSDKGGVFESEVAREISRTNRLLAPYYTGHPVFNQAFYLLFASLFNTNPLNKGMIWLIGNPDAAKTFLADLLAVLGVFIKWQTIRHDGYFTPESRILTQYLVVFFDEIDKLLLNDMRDLHYSVQGTGKMVQVRNMYEDETILSKIANTMGMGNNVPRLDLNWAGAEQRIGLVLFIGLELPDDVEIMIKKGEELSGDDGIHKEIKDTLLLISLDKAMRRGIIKSAIQHYNKGKEPINQVDENYFKEKPIKNYAAYEEVIGSSLDGYNSDLIGEDYRASDMLSLMFNERKNYGEENMYKLQEICMGKEKPSGKKKGDAITEQRLWIDRKLAVHLVRLRFLVEKASKRKRK